MILMEEQCVKVSVVIPVYNVEQYLEECIDSVLNQTYTNYEIILVDDGATDRSGSICDKYAEKWACVKVIHQKNGGLSVARNTGLNEAIGKYVYFLDSDDYIEDMSLEQLVGIAENENADVVFFDGYVFFTNCEADPNVWTYQRKEKYVSENGREILRKLLITDEYRTAVPLMLLKTEYLRKHQLMFREGILHEDELFTFLVYNANGKVCHCHEKLYARRVRPASIMTSSGMVRRYESMLQIYIELSELYTDGKISDEAGKMYMIRTAKSVLDKYNQLEIQDKAKLEYGHRQFKKDVKSHKGFGDMKLKIKCSDGIQNKFYRAENKLMNMLKKV